MDDTSLVIVCKIDRTKDIDDPSIGCDVPFLPLGWYNVIDISFSRSPTISFIRCCTVVHENKKCRRFITEKISSFTRDNVKIFLYANFVKQGKNPIICAANCFENSWNSDAKESTNVFVQKRKIKNDKW